METPELQTIVLPNGKSALVIVPELVEQLAVVDLNVIKRLALLLERGSFSDVRNQLIDKIRSINPHADEALGQYVQALKDEVSFHETVNLIIALPANAVGVRG